MGSVPDSGEQDDSAPRVRYLTGILEQRAGQSLLFDGDSWLGVSIDAGVDASTLTGHYERWVVTFDGAVTARPWSVSGEDRQQESGRAERVEQAAAVSSRVAVCFTEAVEGVDPDDGVRFRSARHKVDAAWSRQDRDETLFVDDLGEVVARWPTRLVQTIEWGQPAAHHASAIDPARSANAERPAWQKAIRSDHACAYDRWTAAEDRALQSKWGNRLSLAEVARLHGRPPGEIAARLVHLGLVDPIPDAQDHDAAQVTTQVGRAETAYAPVGTASNTTTPPRVGSTEWMKRVKSAHPRAYEGWSAAEDDQLIDEWKAGLAVAEISETHERTRGAIRSRLIRLGLE